MRQTSGSESSGNLQTDPQGAVRGQTLAGDKPDPAMGESSGALEERPVGPDALLETRTMTSLFSSPSVLRASQLYFRRLRKE